MSLQPKIDEKEFSYEEVAKYLHLHGKWDELEAGFLRHEAMFKVAAEQGVSVSDAELQAGVDSYRKLNGLYMAKDAQAWLESYGMSLDELEHHCESMLLEQKLLKTVPQEALDGYFADVRANFDRLRLGVIEVGSEPLANELAQQIADEEEEFGDLARAHSQHDSAGQGGLLGWVERGALSEETGTKLWNAEEEGIVRETEGGVFRIYQLLEKVPAELAGEVETKLREAILTSALAEALGMVGDEEEDEEDQEANI